MLYRAALQIKLLLKTATATRNKGGIVGVLKTFSPPVIARYEAISMLYRAALQIKLLLKPATAT